MIDCDLTTAQDAADLSEQWNTAFREKLPVAGVEAIVMEEARQPQLAA
jgi:hypothetical protein